LTPEELQKEISDGELRPAYLIAGPEALFRDDSRDAIRLAVLGEAADSFQIDLLDGSSTTPADLLDALKTLSMLGGRRYVELRAPEAKRGGKLVTALEEAAVEQRGLGSSAPCVLVVLAEKADARSAWVKAFKDPAAFVRCDPLKNGRAMVTFVRGEAKRQGLRLEKGAAESLAERVGPDLLVIRSELAKLGLFAGEGKGISAELVAESVSDLAEEPIWDLTDAIGQGNTGAALRVLRRIRGAGAPEPVVLGALANHWRKLVRIRDGGEVSGHPFAVKKLKSQAARYGPAQLAAGLEGIWELDEILKGRGALEPDLALERLVLNLSR